MIVLTYEELINSQLGLNKILVSSEEGKVPFKVGFKTSKLLKKIDPEIKEFQEKQLELLKKYGTEVMEEVKGPDGSVIMEEKDGVQVPTTKPTGNYNLGANVEIFNKEYKDLLSSEVELNALAFTVNELENIVLSVKEISSLEPLMVS